MKTLSRLALTVAAVFFASVAFAQHGGGTHGGGPRGGGGMHSGPRGGGHGYYGGGRGAYGGGRGWYGGGRGWYGGGRGYYGGHGYYGRGWYGRPWYGGWGWGWGGWWGFSPWWGSGWGYPGYWGGYYGAPAGYVATSYGPGSWAGVKTDVSPEEACVFLDGRYIGTADDFDGYPDLLYLEARARYQLEFRLEGFESQTVDVDAQPGQLVKLDNHLKKIPGAKQYGSYETPVPEGGVQRFWGKSKGSTGAVSMETPSEGSGGWREADQGETPPPAGTPEGSSVAGEPPAAVPATPMGPGSEPPAAAPPARSSRGRVVFRIRPGDAAVYVDDRFAGTGEELSTLGRGLQVSAGPHRIVVSRPGFQSDASQIDVAPGSTETVEISLERP